MDFSVVAAAREDGSTAEEPVRVAVAAERLGHREVRAGEGPAWDSFVLATRDRAGHRAGLADRGAGPGVGA